MVSAVAAAGLLAAVYAVVAHLVNQRVPDSYMVRTSLAPPQRRLPTPHRRWLLAAQDEEFHVRQTQQYCGGDFVTWDPMITTFPGLYFAAVGALTPAASLSARPLPSLCSAPALRLLNLAFGLGTFFCCVDILRSLDGSAGPTAPEQPAYNRFKQLKKARSSPPAPQRSKAEEGGTEAGAEAGASDEGGAVRGALLLSLCPLHFFFAFLFYTDGGANCLVLLAYALALRRRPWASAFAGACSVGFRQTNIVWCGFICCTIMARLLDARLPTGSSAPAAGSSAAPLVALRRYVAGAWSCKGPLLVAIGPFLGLAAAFIWFLKVNGGVVVGDRTAHAPVLHLPQLCYFAVFTFGLLAPFQLAASGLATVASMWKGGRRRELLAGAVCVLGAAVYAVRYHTHAHKYLLADNRHYTFYVWKLFFRREGTVGRLLPYAACPVYALLGWFVALDLWKAERAQHPLWLLLYAVCTTLVLVPAELLEGRYFVLPFFMAALHSPAFGRAKMQAFPLLLSAAVNAATLYLFLFRPFTWPDGSTARFMW